MFRLTVLALLTTLIQSYTTLTLPQRSSYFVGSSVHHHDVVGTVNNRASHAILTMKKGKANVPPQMRSQYARAQEMEGYRKQMVDSQSYGKDGLPVFNLYVRTGLKNVRAFCLYNEIKWHDIRWGWTAMMYLNASKRMHCAKFVAQLFFYLIFQPKFLSHQQQLLSFFYKTLDLVPLRLLQR